MAAAGTIPPQSDRTHQAIVLVHGAWVGEWSWEPVLPLLESTGRRVITVSLTGHGSRRHLSGPHVTLDTHVDDVVGALETFDLTDITLVGHSYGGRVITKTWERARSRIGRMVYLDAHAPIGEPAPVNPAHANAVGGMIPFTQYQPDAATFGSDAGVQWFLQRAMPQSAATFTAPFHVDLPAELPKTYVFATGNEPSRFAGYATGAAADPAWEYIALDGNHWLMATHPHQVASIIAGSDL